MADQTIKYYVYIHYNKMNDNPFYVGRGKNNRYKDKSSRNQYWKNYVNKYGFYSEIIEFDLTLEESYYLEEYWISQLKAWNFKLTNLSNGGEGNNSGVIRSIEWRDKMSIAKLGKPSNKKGKCKFTEKERNENRLKSELNYKLNNPELVKKSKERYRLNMTPEQKAKHNYHKKVYADRIKQEKRTMIF